MIAWTFSAFHAAAGGAWLIPPRDEHAQGVRGVCTDSRSLAPGQAFFAVRGERFDGHSFLEQAAHAGASVLVVEDAPGWSDRAGAGVPAVLRVPDVRAALGGLAHAHRRSLVGTRVIAVVGSNGKTTTTRLIHSVLSTRLRGSASPKSFNNDIGVPLTILGAHPGDDYLVCEVGTNAPGETAGLARIVEPDIAVVTSLGRAHMEFFASLADVAREDAAIFARLRPGGLAIVPHGLGEYDEFLGAIASVVRFGPGQGADPRLTRVAHAPVGPDGATGLAIEVDGRSAFTLPLVGEHNALNALAAITVARRCGLSDTDIARGLASAAPADMRLMRRMVGGVDVFVDCYNANPESAIAAVRTFAALSHGASRRAVVLGDMLELGVHAPSGHRDVADAVLAGAVPELLITVGTHAQLVADRVSAGAPACRCVRVATLDGGEAASVAGQFRPGDAVLLKGSRGMKLERIVEALERRAGASTGAAPAPGSVGSAA